MDTSRKFASSKVNTRASGRRLGSKLGQQGQSLIQVMVSAAVMAILMLALATMNEMQQRTMVAAQINMTRSLLQLSLQQNLQNDAALKNTVNPIPRNPALHLCLSGGMCTGTTGTISIPFNLYDSVGSGTKISGTATAPMYYDYQGVPNCDTSSRQCVFQVFTSYKANCTPGPNCTNPNVTASYTIQQNPAITPVAGAILKPIISPDIVIKGAGTYKGSIYRCDCKQGMTVKYSFLSDSNTSTTCISPYAIDCSFQVQ